MDAKERSTLRALCETIPDGGVTPCCTRAGEDGHHSSWALGMMPHGAAIRAWVAGPLDLLALARTALPVLLDDADAADARIAKAARERDEARADRAALLVVCERFGGDEGVICNGYEDDSGCGSCGANANHSDSDPANHEPNCARLAARQLAAVIRARGAGGAR